MSSIHLRAPPGDRYKPMQGRSLCRPPVMTSSPSSSLLRGPRRWPIGRIYVRQAVTRTPIEGPLQTATVRRRPDPWGVVLPWLQVRDNGPGGSYYCTMCGTGTRPTTNKVIVQWGGGGSGACHVPIVEISPHFLSCLLYRRGRGGSFIAGHMTGALTPLY